jgi:hypothetical protein
MNECERIWLIFCYKVYLSIIHTNVQLPILFGHNHNGRQPFHQSYWDDELDIQQVIQILLYFVGIVGVHLISLFTKWGSPLLQLYLVFTNGRWDSFHVLITSSKHIFIFTNKNISTFQKFTIGFRAYIN